MVLPLGDDNSDRTVFPIVTVVLIAINVLVFVLLQGMGGNDKFTYAFSTVPEEILGVPYRVAPTLLRDRLARRDDVRLHPRSGRRGAAPQEPSRPSRGVPGGDRTLSRRPRGRRRVNVHRVLVRGSFS